MSSKHVPRGNGRDEIVSATVQLIGELGIGDVTLRAVASTAGLSLGSTSYHFVDKANLISVALDRHVTDTQLVVGVALGNPPTPVDDYRAGRIRCALLYVFGDRSVVSVRSELRLAATRGTAYRELSQRSQAAVHQLIGAALDNALMSCDAVEIATVSAILDGACIDAAIEHCDPVAYLAAITGQLQQIFPGLGVQ